MEIPPQFEAYKCEDYFASDKYTKGVWSETEQLWFIVPASEIKVQTDIDFLVIGRPGVDGIEFGYRRGHDGIWVYYPLEKEFTVIAPDVDALIRRWSEGSITI